MTATVRVIFTLFSALLAVSCAPAASPSDENPLHPGLRATLKAFGHIYAAEVSEVQGGYSTWNLKWEDRVVTVYKVYRGIFPIFGREGESFYHNQVDVTLLDALFPLKVGNEVSLGGLYQSSKTEGDGPLWAQVVVQGEAEISIKGRKIPVFLIELSIERQGEKGSHWENRTLWYSPELGFSLKTEYQQGDELFTVRVLSVDVPGDESGPPTRRNLGTVMI